MGLRPELPFATYDLLPASPRQLETNTHHTSSGVPREGLVAQWNEMRQRQEIAVRGITEYLLAIRRIADEVMIFKSPFPVPLHVRKLFEGNVREDMKTVTTLVQECNLTNASWVGLDGNVATGTFRSIDWEMDYEAGLRISLVVKPPGHNDDTIPTIELPQLLTLSGVEIPYEIE